MSDVKVLRSDGDEAGDYVAKLVAGSGSPVEDALRSIGRRTGLGYSAIFGFYHGRRKTAGSNALRRLRELYLAFCQKQVDRYLDEIRI